MYFVLQFGVEMRSLYIAEGKSPEESNFEKNEYGKKPTFRIVTMSCGFGINAKVGGRANVERQLMKNGHEERTFYSLMGESCFYENW